MRLRHKKNAENEILKNPIVIKAEADIISLAEENSFINKGSTDNSGIINDEFYCKPHQIFGNSNPIYLELGMGKGKYITKMSIQNPNINFIGIEKSATIVLKAINNLVIYKNEYCNNVNSSNYPNLFANNDQKSTSLIQYPNLRFMCEDIENIDKVFSTNSIDKIYLNFSDPWPKKRHESRRLTHQKFLSIYEKLLKPGSLIEFKTDNKDLFDFSIFQIKNSNFKLIEFTYDLHNDPNLNKNNIMTEYEEKFSKLGNKICKLIAQSIKA